MKTYVEFVPKHLEKAIDLARSIATFGQLEFGACVRMRITDPVKVLHMDLILTPDVYKNEGHFSFGVNLQMFYKLLKSLNNNEPVEIEADESIMKINQCQHYHTLVNQDVPFPSLSVEECTGPKLTLGTKQFQRYIRALGNVAPIVELHYTPSSNVLFMESVNSMYRTLFSIDTTASPNDYLVEEYRKQFILKFLDTAINPALADKVQLTLGDSLVIHYDNPNLSVLVVQAAYMEG